MKMVQLIKPKSLDSEIKSEKSEEVQSQIPTDPKGIKDYLEIIPNPVGYRMLVRPWSGKKKTKGGLILSDETHDKIQMTTVVGLVVKLGDLCYKDKEKFPTGPWCKEGEFVIYGRYSGSRFQTKYGEHRILNDDEIIGKIKAPEDILHLF
tara:strand:- start:1367 stop:1816 length:450 start_codon:yes stop_codon:yes gene_type:complete